MGQRRATVAVARDGEHGQLVWSTNLSTVGVVLSVLVAVTVLTAALFGTLRFALHPMVVEEVDRGISTHVEKFDGPAHIELERKMAAMKDERLRQLGEVKADLQYIRQRVDQIVDTQAVNAAAAAARSR